MQPTAPTLAVLVVDDVPEVRTMLARAVVKLGYRAREAAESEGALAACEAEMPDIVLTDIHMPGTDGLELTHRIRQRWPECPVVVMTGHSDEDSAIAALKSGASDYLKKPIDLHALKSALDGVAQVLGGQREESLSGLPVERMEYSMTVDNALDQVLALSGYLARDAAPLLTGFARFHLRIALQELVTNAIEHGNLEITSQDKSESLLHGNYEAVVAARCRDPRYRARRVTVTVTYDRTGSSVRYRVADQGPGFDWRRELRLSGGFRPQIAGQGRGIQLAKTLVGELIYNDKGNEVTLTLPVILN